MVLCTVLIALSATLGLASQIDNPPYIVRGFKKYWNYVGNLSVRGTVGIGMSGNGQTLQWDLLGIPSDCANGPTSSPNSCGIHIHVGTNCAVDAGGHYFSILNTSDPWKTVTYTTGRGSQSQVLTGLSGSDILGRTLIVHDSTGARIACGIIAQGHNVFTKYFGYTGNLTVKGTAILSPGAGTDTQLLQWNLQGIDSSCTQPRSNTPNSCGIHVHKGTSCTEDAQGHYFASGLSPDPWATIVYTAASKSAGKQTTGASASGSASVATQLQLGNMIGHTLVIHDVTGARIGCGIAVSDFVVCSQCGLSGAFCHHLDLAALVLVWVIWAMQ